MARFATWFPQGRTGDAPVSPWLAGMALLCLAFAAWIAIRYAGQPPLDWFSFRQTQTALSAYWVASTGFKLAYETPVVGPPWSLPFEFPLYQWIVSAASRLLHVPLDATGRLTSFAFLLLTLLPARAITRLLDLPDRVWWLFVALLLSSPLYLYWGRSFMIETAAVFFAVAAIRQFLELRQPQAGPRNMVLFMLWMALAMLQKSTTALPVLAVLGLVLATDWLRALAARKGLPWNDVAKYAMLFLVPFAIGVWWTVFTDHVRAVHPLGQPLSTTALHAWFWGTLEQRMSIELYRDVLWHRMVEGNLGGVLGGLAIVAAFVLRGPRHAKAALAWSLVLGVLPLFVFTNLHMVHSYYQTGNMIFLLYGLAIALGALLAVALPVRGLAVALGALVVASNLWWFMRDAYPTVSYQYDAGNSRDFAIGEFLRHELRKDEVFVAFGNDWSSTFAYMSGHKSYTVPGFAPGYPRIVANPERYVGDYKLGAVVACPGPGMETSEDLQRWASIGRKWRVVAVKDCYVAVPGAAEVAEPSGLAVAVSQCEGSLDVAQLSARGDSIDVAGWTTVSGKDGRLPERIYVSVRTGAAPTVYFQAFAASRPDVNAFFHRSDGAFMGFARGIPVGALKGPVEIGVARVNAGRFEACPLRKTLSIGEKAP